MRFSVSVSVEERVYGSRPTRTAKRIMRFAIPVCQIPYTRMMRSTLTNVAVNQESNSEV